MSAMLIPENEVLTRLVAEPRRAVILKAIRSR